MKTILTTFSTASGEQALSQTEDGGQDEQNRKAKWATGVSLQPVKRSLQTVYRNEDWENNWESHYGKINRQTVQKTRQFIFFYLFLFLFAARKKKKSLNSHLCFVSSDKPSYSSCQLLAVEVCTIGVGQCTCFMSSLHLGLGLQVRGGEIVCPF